MKELVADGVGNRPEPQSPSDPGKAFIHPSRCFSALLFDGEAARLIHVAFDRDGHETILTPYERKDIGLAWPPPTRDIDLILCRYSAAWSAALLGDAGSAAVLKSFVRPDFPWPEDALKVAVRRM